MRLRVVLCGDFVWEDGLWVGDLYEQREWERGQKAEVGEGEIPFLLWVAWLIEGLARDARAPGIE